MREIPKYGDLMSMEDFVETCLHFDFIDYDGFGYYSDGIKMSEKVIYPSNIIDDKYDKSWKFVVWMNR